MKIAVLTDVHSNLPALQAAIEHVEAWQPDQVIMAGDLVNRGPRPAECLQLVLERVIRDGWRLVRGNHEEYVIQFSKQEIPQTGPAFEVHRPVWWTYRALHGDVLPLKNMADYQSLIDPDGNEIRFIHGSMLGMRDGIYPETSDLELLEKLGQPDHNRNLVLFCVGHTHRPLIRNLNGTLIINAGSTGLPFDGDHRLSYAQLTFSNHAWHAKIVRLNYDFDMAESDFYTTGYLENAGPLADLVYIELLTARSMLYGWAIQYQEAALAGEISMEDSVKRFRQSIGV